MLHFSNGSTIKIVILFTLPTEIVNRNYAIRLTIEKFYSTHLAVLGPRSFRAIVALLKIALVSKLSNIWEIENTS